MDNIDLYTSNDTNINVDRKHQPDSTVDNGVKSNIDWITRQSLEDVIDEDCFSLRCYLRASPEAKLTATDRVSALIQRNKDFIAHLMKLNDVLGDPQNLHLPDVVI